MAAAGPRGSVSGEAIGSRPCRGRYRILLYVTGPGRYSVDAALGRADAFGTTRKRQDVA